MRARRIALLLAVVLGYYVVVLGDRGVALVRTGRPAFVGLGIGVLLLPLVGGWILVAEMRFGRQTERMGRQLATEGELPEDDGLRRLPSGRVDPAAADEAFERRKAEVESAPDDWRAWYRLALAYGDARDTARGRQAMRRAIALHRDAAG